MVKSHCGCQHLQLLQKQTNKQKNSQQTFHLMSRPPPLLSHSLSACSKTKNIKEDIYRRRGDDVSQTHGRRRIGTSAIRGRCCAPKLKLVHCGVELVRDYCSLYPVLNLSCCSGSTPSCARLFEVGKIMQSCFINVLSVCVSVSLFLSLLVEEEIWNMCLFWILLFAIDRGALCRFTEVPKPAGEAASVWCNSM